MIGEINKSHLLLVEGSTDLFFIADLRDKASDLAVFPQIEWKNTISNSSGINFVKTYLPEFIKGSLHQKIGVVVDADENFNDRQNEIIKILGDQFPSDFILDSNGLVTTLTNGKKFGLWLWPDNKNKGNLEDLLGSLMIEGKPKNSFDFSKKTIQELIENKLSFFKNSDASKAEIYTWLAWQEEPGQPFGKAVKYGYLDTETETLIKFKTWLKNLFSDQI